MSSGAREKSSGTAAMLEGGGMVPERSVRVEVVVLCLDDDRDVDLQ